MELYQRIEHLIDKKLPLYKTEEDEVMLLVERVNEAQRFARMVSVVKREIYYNRHNYLDSISFVFLAGGGMLD